MKNYKKISKILAVSFLPLLINGCTETDPTVYSDGYFEYIHINKNVRYYQNVEEECLAIVGLTNSGSSQESIDIPREINGLPVRYLGTYDYTEHFGAQRGQYLKLNIGSRTKIYVFENIIDAFLEDDACVYMCTEREKGIVQSGNNTYYSVLNTNHEYEINNGYAKYSNVSFVDESNALNKVYRIENIENGEKVPEPSTPAREGYSFEGWYADKEFTNKWNFDDTPTITEDTSLIFYANWKLL